MPNEEQPKRRGAPLKGDKPRGRYNVTLDPDLVEAGKKIATKSGKSFSELLEDGLKVAIAAKARGFKDFAS